MMTPSEETAGRSKRHYLRKARQVVFAILEEIAHNNSERLFRAIKERQLYEKMTGIACC
jgi:sensor domain CHASE-containing protein